MFKALVAFLAAAFAVLASFADAGRTVSVGYYAEPGMMNGAEEGAEKSGYAYEYIQEIASRAGWRYRYVYGSFDALYEKLRRGEIDLLPYVNYSESRTREIAFPGREMGSESFSLAARTRGVIVDDVARLAGKRVGTSRGSFDRMPFVELMRAHGLPCELVEFDDVESRWKALRDGVIDYSIESSSMRQGDGVYAVYPLPGAFPYYLAVAPGRDEVLAELNTAQEELSRDDPAFLHQLKFRYLSGVPIFKMLSANSAKWLAEHSVVRVGSYEGMRPFVYRDAAGEIAGVAPDSLRRMFGELGVQTPVEWSLFNGRESGLSALKQNQVDLIYPYYHNRADAEREGVIVSSVVFDAPFGLVYRGEYSESTLSRIATPATRLGAKYVRDEYPRATCLRCGTGQECVAKVRKGEATCAMMYLGILQQLVADIGDDELKIKILNAPCRVCFAARPSNAALIGLVNKAIPFLDHLERNEIEDRHSLASTVRVSDLQFFRKHPVYVLGAAFVFAAIVAMALMHRAFRRYAGRVETSLALVRRENGRLVERKTQQDYFMCSFSLACLVNLADGTYRVLHADGAFAAAFGEGGLWREALAAFAARCVRPDGRETALRLGERAYVGKRLKMEPSFSFAVRASLDDAERILRVVVLRCGEVDRVAVGFTDLADEAVALGAGRVAEPQKGTRA